VRSRPPAAAKREFRSIK